MNFHSNESNKMLNAIFVNSASTWILKSPTIIILSELSTKLEKSERY